MTALVRPDPSLCASWAAAVTEFGDTTMHGAGLWDFDQLDVTEPGCRAVVEHLLAQADPRTEMPEGRVHCTYFWIVDGDGPEPEFVGYLALRHSLTPWLLEEGGHIGYSVRPSRRGEGHAGRALVAGVRAAAELGIDPVLVTCDEDNEPSRRTIERAGGVYEDSRQGKRRYWITTQRQSGAGDGPASPAAGV